MSRPVVPRPQSVSSGSGDALSGDSDDERVPLDDLSAVVHDDGDLATAGATRVARLLADELGVALDTVSDSPADGVPVRVRHDAAVDGDEGYRLSVSSAGIVLAASTVTGFSYAGQTLAQLAGPTDGGLSVPACEVVDRPAFEWRGFMADPARGFIPVDRLQTLVDRMARAKLNRLHLHLTDSEAWTLALERYPELAEGPHGETRPTYSHDDVRDLVAYAAEREVTVVPEIDVPGHGLTLLSQLPGLRCDTGEDVRVFGKKAEICVGQERTYEFLEDVFDEVVDLFPGEVVHVGADEWFHHGTNWEHCERCRRRMDAEGHDGVRDLYYYFLRRVHGILADRDRRMMVWNDQIDVSESPDLPTDILIHFWLVSHGDWGPPQAGNSMQRFVEEGFEVVNSRTTATYVNAWKDGALLEWTPTSLPAVDPEYEDGVLGGEMPAWNGWKDAAWQRYFQRVLPSALPVFADRVWNGAPIDDHAAFSEGVTRHVLGPYTPPGFDLYREFGGVLLPTGDADSVNWANVLEAARGRSFADAIASCRRSLETLGELESVPRPPATDVVDAYSDTLRWQADALDRERRGVSHKPQSVPDVDWTALVGDGGDA